MMNIQRTLRITSLVLAVSAAGVILAACSGYGGQATTQQTNPSTGSSAVSQPVANAVTIQNMAFSPKNLQVKVGQAVTWTNQDAVGHSATADDNSFDTGILGQGQSKAITFSKAGTFTYHCSVHPSMTATITVSQ